jgi:hypothetical protein
MDDINGDARAASRAADPALSVSTGRPSPAQRRYLRLGIGQPGGKLPLFDSDGQEIDPRTIRSCIEHGWAEPWFDNPVHRNWLVCRLTTAGKQIAAD